MSEIDFLSEPGPSSLPAYNVPASTPAPNRQQDSEDVFMDSPGLSQIAPSSSRRLFGQPSTPTIGNRFISTPVHQPPGNDFDTDLEYLHDAMLSDSVGRYQGNKQQNIQENYKKRRIGALFEDVFVPDDTDHLQKKQKNERDQDENLIRLIMDGRLQNRNRIDSVKEAQLLKIQHLDAFRRRNLSASVPNWPFTPWTRTDGGRVYVRTHSEEFERKELNEIKLLRAGEISLLGTEKERVWNSAREIINNRLTESENKENDIPGLPEAVAVPKVATEQLWVEKYRPRKYIDLISDETTNRTILKWIKMWDQVVFNRKPKPAAVSMSQESVKNKLNTFNKTTGRFESTGGWQTKRKTTSSHLNTERDEMGRPIQKVLLIAGSPGLGKTTLAHVIAQHAGYDVRELNASDDRSVEAFRQALEGGTQMKSVLTQERRPNCMVLDEIDGAPQAALDYLLKFITDKVEVKAVGQKKSKGDKTHLRRPIICICNDLYVPALRQLRQVAFVVNFPSVSSARLADRLYFIAKKEGIRTDLGTMLVLAEKTSCDVRCCLALMQFHSVNKQPLGLHDVLKQTIGQKDENKGLFQIWSAIFQIQRPRRILTDRKDNNNDGGEECTTVVGMSDMSLTTRMDNILHVVQSHGGDYERLMQGIHENFLNQKFSDNAMRGTAESIDWFTYQDRIQSMINQYQNYNIYPYLPFAFVVWHFNFGSLNWPTLTFPSKGFEVHQKTQTQKMIFASLRHGMSPTLKGIGGGAVILLDTVPYIRQILCPHIRSVSEQLLTRRERDDLQHTIEVMVDLGLTYSQIQLNEGKFKYQLEPDLEHISMFPDVAHVSCNYWTCQLLSRELQEEYIRRATPKQKSNSNKVAGDIGSSNADQMMIDVAGMDNVHGTELNKATNLEDSRKSLSRDFSNVKEVVVQDFFGRKVVRIEPLSVHEGGTDLIVKSPIWFRFKEGYNNAVRRDITISDLM